MRRSKRAKLFYRWPLHQHVSLAHLRLLAKSFEQLAVSVEAYLVAFVTTRFLNSRCRSFP
jgi:hypothetical protein